MRQSMRSAFVFLLLLLISTTLARPDVISDLCAEISQTSYTNYLDNLLYTHLGDDRGIGGYEHDLARDNILNAFASFGLTASLDPFQYSGNTYHNVIGVLQGRTRPDEVYIVGAHYDSADTPGADDNASGVAGVLEIARVASRHPWECTIIFAAWDREEQGMRGSRAWVSENLTLNILGVANLDMIAYNPGGTYDDWARIYSTNASDPLRTAWADALATYGGITVTLPPNLPASDHVSFEEVGYMAATLIEYHWNTNPNYHRWSDSVDTPGYIDYTYATNLTRGTAAWLARQAVLVPEPATIALLAVGVPVLVARIRRRRAA